MQLVELVGEFVLDFLMLLAERTELRLVLHLKLLDLALQLGQLAVSLPVELQLNEHTHTMTIHARSMYVFRFFRTRQTSNVPCAVGEIKFDLI